MADLPWTWMHQVHGPGVLTVTAPGEHAGASADAAVTDVTGAVLAVTTADCAPVVFLAEEAVGVAHAGWRGVLAGVVGATADALVALGHPPLSAWVGPCIGAECYEFGEDALEPLVARFGAGVRATTAGGAPALDLRSAVTAALGEVGVERVEHDLRCTSCDASGCWSHRARGESRRMATVVWLSEPAR